MTFRELRKLILVIFVLFAFFPLYGIIVVKIVGDEHGKAIMILVAPYVVAYLYQGVRIMRARCPVCGNPFFRRLAFSFKLFSCHPHNESL